MADEMKWQWDALANENVFYSVVSWPEFEDPLRIDLERFWQSGRDDAERFLRCLNLREPEKLTLVEIGCGIGRMTHWFAERFQQVYGFDVSPEMLERARSYWSHLRNVEFILGSGTDLQPLPDASVDAVFSYICLQHITEPPIVFAYVREASRVLKPGGIAFLQLRTTSNRLTCWLWQLGHRLNKLSRGWFGNKRRSLHAYWSDTYEAWRGCTVLAADVEQTCEESGLDIENVLGRGTQYTYYTLRKVRGQAVQR